jgi:hypothetical protein
MKNIENYKSRFFSLMESTMGDVKPLISEQETSPTGGTETVATGGGSTDAASKLELFNNTFGSEVIGTIRYVVDSTKPGSNPNTIQFEAYIPTAEPPLNGRRAKFEVTCDPTQFRGLVEPIDWFTDKQWLSVNNIAPWPVGKQALNLQNKDVRNFITQACQTIKK